MIKALSYARGVRDRLAGYGFDREMQENFAAMMAFRASQFAKGRVFPIGHANFLFQIADGVVVDFQVGANPHEFDAEGCEEHFVPTKLSPPPSPPKARCSRVRRRQRH